MELTYKNDKRSRFFINNFKPINLYIQAKNINNNENTRFRN